MITKLDKINKKIGWRMTKLTGLHPALSRTWISQGKVLKIFTLMLRKGKEAPSFKLKSFLISPMLKHTCSGNVSAHGLSNRSPFYSAAESDCADEVLVQPPEHHCGVKTVRPWLPLNALGTRSRIQAPPKSSPHLSVFEKHHYFYSIFRSRLS